MRTNYLDALAYRIEVLTAAHGVPARVESAQALDQGIVITMAGRLADVPNLAGEIELATGARRAVIRREVRRDVVVLT